MALNNNFDLPLSPSSLPELSPNLPSLDITQLWTPIKSIVASTGIPLELVEEWKAKYNRVSVPIMNDDAFYQLVLNNVQDPSDTAGIERALQTTIAQKSADLQALAHTARYNILLPGTARLESESQKSGLTSLMGNGLAMQDVWFFVAKCLPDLVNTDTQSSASRHRGTRIQTNTNARSAKSKSKLLSTKPRHVQSRVSKRPLSKHESLTPRRSLRLANQHR